MRGFFILLDLCIMRSMSNSKLKKANKTNKKPEVKKKKAKVVRKKVNYKKDENISSETFGRGAEGIKNKDVEEMLMAFDEIQMPRTPYVLENMVVNSKFTLQQKYAQCVLEMSIAYDNLRTARCGAELKQIEIDKIKGKDRKAQLEKEVKKIELEQLNRARLGAMREFEYLFKLWKSFGRTFTREELNSAQEMEYTLRLETQARQDMNASGRISVSNQEGLRQIGRFPYPELDISRKVEKRFLESGKYRIMIAVPTEEKAEKGLPCIEGIEFPNGAEIKIYNSWGRKVDDSYNHIVETALADKADFIFTVEDDTFPPKDALVRLMKLFEKNENCAVGAWYPKKEINRQGVHIEIIKGKRGAMPDDGQIHEAYTMAMGCSVYPIEMFMKIPYPWFKTTENLSQDSFFSQLARENGYKLLVDTSIKCRHIDRRNGDIYE